MPDGPIRLVRRPNERWIEPLRNETDKRLLGEGYEVIHVSEQAPEQSDELIEAATAVVTARDERDRLDTDAEVSAADFADYGDALDEAIEALRATLRAPGQMRGEATDA